MGSLSLSLMDPTSKSLQNHGQKVMCEKIVFLATILARKLWQDAIKYRGQIDNFLGGHENLTGEIGHLYMLVNKYPHFIIGGEGGVE